MPAFLCECLHALTGERRAFTEGPIDFSRGGPKPGGNLILGECLLSLRRVDNTWWLVPGGGLAARTRAWCDGTRISASMRLSPTDAHALVVDGEPWILVLENRAAPRIDAALWRLHPTSGAASAKEGTWPEIVQHVRGLGTAAENAVVTLESLPREFPLSALARHLSGAFDEAPTPAGWEPPPAPTAASPLDALSGQLLCPVCWLRFERGSARAVAVHDSLRGDPLLGEDARRRFAPIRFNPTGVALDDMGSPCPDLACPHCHHKLPTGFLDLQHHILSIVGAPGAGKSYYLSVLINMLQATFYREFGLTFRDEDPTSNALLNEMRAQLFSAERREEAVLPKTVLEGRMYERLARFGRKVALPKPFVYGLGRPGQPGPSCAVVFYDNAGEHFQPNINLDDSPGALHVASSSGILFLFDPTSHGSFRKKLLGHPDPQLAQRTHRDQQDILIAEMESRIKRLRSLSPSQRIQTPLAIMIGKCDIWRHLVDWGRIVNPVRAGSVDANVVDGNSSILRDLLLEVDPGFVANAEALSSNVRYFAVSALGHSPERISGGELDGYLAPDPTRLRPTMVEVPVLWVLSQVEPGLLGTHHSAPNAHPVAFQNASS